MNHNVTTLFSTQEKGDNMNSTFTPERNYHQTDYHSSCLMFGMHGRVFSTDMPCAASHAPPVISSYVFLAIGYASVRPVRLACRFRLMLVLRGGLRDKTPSICLRHKRQDCVVRDSFFEQQSSLPTSTLPVAHTVSRAKCPRSLHL
jgi:hypothetical protein